MYFKPFNRHVLCHTPFTNIKIRLISTSCIRLCCWSQILGSASTPRACNQLHLCWTSCTFVILLKSAGLFTSIRQVCVELIPWADPPFSLALLWIWEQEGGKKKKSALGPQNSAPRDHTGDKTVALRPLVSVKEKRITQTTRMASGGRRVLGDKRDYGEQESGKLFHWSPVWAEPFELLWKITSTSRNGRNGRKTVEEV